MYPQAQSGYPQGPGYQQQGYPTAGGYSAYPQSNFNQQPTLNMHMGPSTNQTDNSGNNYGWTDPVGPFAEKSIRNAFVSKVYAILSIQLAFTSLMIGIFVLNPEIKSSFKPGHGSGWFFLGFGIFFIAYMVLICVESTRRTFPINFIMLSVLTFGYSLVAAIASCKYDTTIVLFAFVATAVSTVLITMLAKSMTFDMTTCGHTLCILAMAHMIIGMLMVLILVPLGYARLGSLLLSISGAFLVSLYLMYDTQLIIGGRKAELSPEEYILGAILLYVDIVQLFLYLLEIFSRLSDD